MADIATAGLLMNYVRGTIPQPAKSNLKRTTALGRTERTGNVKMEEQLVKVPNMPTQK